VLIRWNGRSAGREHTEGASVHFRILDRTAIDNAAMSGRSAVDESSVADGHGHNNTGCCRLDGWVVLIFGLYNIFRILGQYLTNQKRDRA
jgi:hypothetical protein